jgi:hypothetical protein
MSASVQPVPPSSDIEATLREELAGGDYVARTITPILKHLLGNVSNSAFTDDVIASSRGMMNDVARQFAEAVAHARGEAAVPGQNPDATQIITATLAESSALLAHIHALALEWQLTQRLQTRLTLDPVLPPLLQNLMASSDPATGSLAMHVLAAQVRFCQSQRRMQLPLNELPADLLHGALLALRETWDAGAAAAEAQLRQRFDESKSRVALTCRLIMSLGTSASASLSITDAGVAVFISALAMASRHSRDRIALATNDSQIARLALALRASGMRPQDVEAQFFAIHPEIALPLGFDQLSPDRAAAILASAPQIGGM